MAMGILNLSYFSVATDRKVPFTECSTYKYANFEFKRQVSKRIDTEHHSFKRCKVVVAMAITKRSGRGGAISYCFSNLGKASAIHIPVFCEIKDYAYSFIESIL